jgi:hypothetical protein
MRATRNRKVEWAIFSDLYGIWFPEIQHEWYERSPDNVSEEEFKRLLSDFYDKLEKYEEIWFYYNPGRFHSLYARLLVESKSRRRITRFTHIAEIV